MKTAGKGNTVAGVLYHNMVILLLLLMVAAMTVLNRNFLTLSNIMNILVEMSTYGVVTMAMTVAIICGEFDLSVGSTFALCAVIFIDLVNRAGILVAALAALAVGGAGGLINGLLVSKTHIPAFVATLGTMVALRGLALFYTDGQPVSSANNTIAYIGNGTFLGIPNLVIMFFAVLLATFYLLRYTRFGRNIYATGGNKTVAELAGIHAGFYKMMIFVILGLAAGLAAIMIGCRMSSGNAALFGLDLSMSAIAAVVVGGTSLSGGSGGVWKSLIGLLVIGVLFNALTLMGIQAYYQQLIRGLVVIVIVAADLYMNLNKK